MFSRIKRKKEEERRAIMKAHRAKVVKVAGASVILGALGGILLAPKSGKETRKDIIDGVYKKGKTITNNSSSVIENASNSLQDKKEKISTSKKKIKDYLKKKKDEVDISIEECFSDISKLSKDEKYLEESIPNCISKIELDSDSKEELIKELKNTVEDDSNSSSLNKDNVSDCCSDENEKESCCCKNKNEENVKLSDKLDHLKDEIEKRKSQTD